MSWTPCRTASSTTDGEVRDTTSSRPPMVPKHCSSCSKDEQQLAVYQFMDNGPDDFCPGCTHFTNNMTNLAELADSGVSWATVSNMPIAQIEAYKARMGWTMPFLSSRATTFSHDTGAEYVYAQRVPARR